MKLVTLLLLTFISTLYSCKEGSENTGTNGEDEIDISASEIHPNVLFENNCAMCHGYNENRMAPAITRYSIDSVLNFYDGKSRTDSVWELHKKIQLSRDDWEKIAVQMQPGDIFPKN